MKAIAAMESSRVIGSKGKIPWHIPAEMQWFKECTSHCNLIMGNTTFESIGPLKNRFIYVLTNDPQRLHQDPTPYYKYIDYNHLPDLFGWAGEHTWLCGGTKTYIKLLPHCTELYMSYILDDYDGDAYMPAFEHLFPNSEIYREHKDFWVVRYWK